MTSLKQLSYMSLLIIIYLQRKSNMCYNAMLYQNYKTAQFFLNFNVKGKLWHIIRTFIFLFDLLGVCLTIDIWTLQAN